MWGVRAERGRGGKVWFMVFVWFGWVGEVGGSMG